VLVCLGAIEGCAAGSSTDEGNKWLAGEAMVCLPGRQEPCQCQNGVIGVSRCLADGTGLTACVCEDKRWDRNNLCGNGACETRRGEHCHTCAEDCGACEPCDTAPACEDAMIPPETVPHLTDFDVPRMQWIPPAQIQGYLESHVSLASDGMRVVAAALDGRAQPGESPLVTRLRRVFDENPAAAAKVRRQLGAAGLDSPSLYREHYPALTPQMASVAPEQTAYGGEFPWPTECGKPLLRLGVQRLVVHEEDDDIDNDIVYCVIQAEAITGGEVRVTPKTPNLDEGESHTFSLNSGVFWGQMRPTYAGSDLFVTYDCFEADTDDGYANLMFAIGEASMGVGGAIPGDSGWVFTVVGLVSTIVGAALSLDGDDYLFSATQTIPEEHHLELTNGAYWTVRKDGTHILSDWDWELYIRAWGCAEFGTL
jgi:hypothetical protein